MAKPCTPHPHCAACAVIRATNWQCRGSRGPPRPFSWGCKGDILFPKRMPPLEPQEKGEGCSPRPPTLPDWSSKGCTRCALHSRWQLCCLTDVAYPLRVIGCGVHGFAMNPCNSRPLSTAPYYREARVTSERRQTACRMRHCWRSPHCGVLR